MTFPKLAATLCLSLVFLYGIFAAGFQYGLHDPSAGAPLYDGPIISDARQKPLRSRFNHETTAAELVEGLDLRGKVIVVTGGHSGTGLEAVKALTSAGATVIALARDVKRAEENLRRIAHVEIEAVDLLQPESIDAFAKKFLAQGRPLHILINSAAIMGIPLERDRRGYERQFATNVLGHFALTARLLPALKRANGARIVNLSSRGHRVSGVLFDDIHFKHTEYSGMRAYAQSKAALVLLTVKLDALLREHKIRAYAVHPGPVPSSDLFAAGRVGSDSRAKVWLARLHARLARVLHVTEALNIVRRPKNVGDLYKTVQQGAATTVWAATSEDLEGFGGVYLEDCNIAVVVPNGSTAPFGVRPWAFDEAAAERLWRFCEEMTGIRFAALAQSSEAPKVIQSSEK
ncbi:MAG: SDR family NAD(P)-dependent oxidoreductase [Candidatus Accumulibacter sp.]|jgi:NAD(P)-dependent dehydrogenase (short-subunit alcohol dehydrogenase family)|nr:SDR family NAD(P)-dependent oxidoreductase [Accumulibacter sp.]